MANMARKQRLSHREAKALLEAAGINFRKDVFTLPTSSLSLVADTAKAAGYRKSKNAPGSTGRMYFQFLSRMA
jgi:hypothetical protein